MGNTDSVTTAQLYPLFISSYGNEEWNCVPIKFYLHKPLLVSWETCMQVKKQQLELNMEQQIGSKLGKEYVKAVYCHPII